MQKHDTEIGIPGFFLFDKNRLRVGLLYPLYHCISLRSSFLLPSLQLSRLETLVSRLTNLHRTYAVYMRFLKFRRNMFQK